MPGNRKHHTDKWHSCVEKVMAEGHDESSASAICTASLEKAGEPIFMAAEENDTVHVMRTAGGPGSGWTAENGHVPGSHGGTTGQKLEKAGYKAIKEGEKLPHIGVGPDKVPLGHTAYIREFATEQKAFEAQDNFHYHEHPGAVASSVVSPQASNKFYPKHVHEIHVKHTDAQQKLKGLAENMRTLHLLGATGTARTEQYDGREHLVVPVVALMEGVIHAVNASTPEFVSVATLTKAATSWNGRPVMLGHPVKDGKQCSANAPEAAAARIGTIFNTRVEGKKLLCEAWVDKARAELLHPEMYKRLLANKTEEVSVGAHVVTDDVAGEHGGKKFKASWLETTGDHLAFLPGGRGACSVAMGCGTHRAAMHLVTAGALEMRSLIEHVSQDFPGALTTVFSALAGDSLDERIRAVNDAVTKKWGGSGQMTSPSNYAYAQAVFDDHVIVRWNEELYSVDYTVNAEGAVEFVGEPTKVEQVYVAAAVHTADCELCKGSGNVDGNPCETCAGAGEIRSAAGKRHSAEDVTLIQAVHDHAMALGAECSRGNYKQLAAGVPQLKAACACQGESTMDKKVKAELIAALVADKHSGFKEGDEAFLETAADARLESFRAAAETNKAAAEKAAKDENDLRAAQAKLTVTEGKLKAAEATPTEEQWLERAPAGVKTLLENQKVQETERREELVKMLKVAGANTEDELKAMPTAQLETLAKYAKVQTVDFSGRAIPVDRAAANNEDDKQYDPPNPWEAGIKALQEAGKATVN